MTTPVSGTTAPTRYVSVAPRGGLVFEGGTDALLADGAIIRIRPVRPADVAELTALHERASDETLYRRFLSTGHHGIAGEVARINRPADTTFAALVSVERGMIVGVCTY